jgi:glycerol-3-phosphate acyltransferase PlsY
VTEPNPPTLSYLRPVFHEEQDFRGGRAVLYTGGVFVLVAAAICATMLLMNVSVWPALIPVALSGSIITLLMFLSKMAFTCGTSRS